jgi:hypothetical protein
MFNNNNNKDNELIFSPNLTNIANKKIDMFNNNYNRFHPLNINDPISNNIFNNKSSLP